MPKRYKKKNYRKKNQLSKINAYATTGQKVATTAFTALKLASTVARMVNVEIKHHDIPLTLVNVDNAGVIINLSSVPQGDTSSSRDGASIKPLHLTIRGVLSQNASLTVGSTFRIIIFRGKQENGSVPTVLNFLESSSIVSPKNYSNRFHYKTLMDKTITLDSRNVSQRFFQQNFKVYGHINWQEGSANIENGGFYMLLLNNNVPANPQSFSYFTRLTYTDN